MIYHPHGGQIRANDFVTYFCERILRESPPPRCNCAAPVFLPSFFSPSPSPHSLVMVQLSSQCKIISPPLSHSSVFQGTLEEESAPHCRYSNPRCARSKEARLHPPRIRRHSCEGKNTIISPGCILPRKRRRKDSIQSRSET